MSVVHQPVPPAADSPMSPPYSSRSVVDIVRTSDLVAVLGVAAESVTFTVMLDCPLVVGVPVI